MDIKLTRRSMVTATVGSYAAFALAKTSGFAQSSSPVASPAASPAAAPTLAIVPGPGDGEFTVTHTQGETVVKADPKKIVAIDATTIDTLQTLSVEIAGIPELQAGDFLKTDGIETIGTMQEPDLEKINEIGPDLIFIGPRTSESYDALKGIAPTVNMAYGQGDVIPQLRAAATVIGTIVNKQDEVETKLGEIESRVETLKDKVADVGTCLVVIVSGGSVTALAPDNERGGRGALIYKTLGIKPAVENLKTATHGEPISFEFLLEHNPDWLFVIDRDKVVTTEGDTKPAEQVLDNEIMHGTTAWTKKQIVYLNPFDWYTITGAGLTSINRQLDELEKALVK